MLDSPPERLRQRWLSIIGIGDDGLDSLSPIARSLLDQAQLVVGGQRHLAMLPASDQQQLTWTTPINHSIDLICQQQGQAVCILASGDPLCYGIGTAILRCIPIEQVTIVPAPTAFSLAASRLGWSLPEVETISLCGRHPYLINALLYPGAKILALSADRFTPGIVANILNQQGKGDVQMTILEHLGGAAENISTSSAAAWPGQEVAQLNMMALTCPATISGLARSPGLPDDSFYHDGQITKREVRAMTLAALAPLPGQVLWDVGAGSGSISIEWMRSHPRNLAVAIEQHPQRRQNIANNAAALGVPNLQIVSGAAPVTLYDLTTPDAIFIGGGLTIPDVFEKCWHHLKNGGRLVANAVTVETEQQIFQLHSQYGGTLSRIAVQRAEPIGSFLGWKALPPITQWCVVKT
jgi:precorrin-6B C5,15-methyltransferase / cobalt-precorrin-6B C5,C15-methyltransferase